MPSTWIDTTFIRLNRKRHQTGGGNIVNFSMNLEMTWLVQLQTNKIQRLFKDENTVFKDLVLFRTQSVQSYLYSLLLF